MKKLFTLVLALCLILSLAACAAEEETVVEETVSEDVILASDEATLELDPADDTIENTLVDASGVMVGVWIDEANNVYNFVEDYTCAVYDPQQDVELGGYFSVVADSETVLLTMELEGSELAQYVVDADETGTIYLYEFETGAHAMTLSRYTGE